MKRHAVVLLAIALGAGGTDAVSGQSLGDVIENAADGEVKRQADRRTREAVQCVTGARDCAPAQDRSARNRAAAGEGPTDGSSSQAVEAFIVPAIAGAMVDSHDSGRHSDYRRITGFQTRQIKYADQYGVLTRTRYRLTGDQTPGQMIAAWREPLLAQGMVLEWQCSRKAQCGSSSYHQLGAGYMPVNGINLGIAGDVRYFTGRLVRDDLPTVYIAVALNRTVAYVDVLEVDS